MNLTHCTPVLFVKNAAIAKEFYVNILGFTVIMDNGGMNYAFKEGLAVWQSRQHHSQNAENGSHHKFKRYFPF
jgi:catechol 2,3-dioxygenase-like lactoylglutathione lyase family enzyme